MFERLVESTVNAKETKKRSAYLGLTTVVYTAFLVGLMVWSVFSFDLADLNRESDLTLETLVAPAKIEEPEIPQPRVNPPPRNNQTTDSRQNVDLLQNPVVSIKNSTRVPDGITTDKVAANEVRENMPFEAANVTKYSDTSGGRSVNVSNPPAAETAKTKPNTDEIDIPPPPVIKKHEAPVQKKAGTVTKGVVNSIAVSLPKPPYPAPARAINVSGAVNVQVLIDEKGNVVSAVATSGHPLLKASAVNAARQAKFTPTILSDQPVKVTGVIIYNFVP